MSVKFPLPGNLLPSGYELELQFGLKMSFFRPTGRFETGIMGNELYLLVLCLVALLIGKSSRENNATSPLRAVPLEGCILAGLFFRWFRSSETIF